MNPDPELRRVAQDLGLATDADSLHRRQMRRRQADELAALSERHRQERIVLQDRHRRERLGQRVAPQINVAERPAFADGGLRAALDPHPDCRSPQACPHRARCLTSIVCRYAAPFTIREQR